MQIEGSVALVTGGTSGLGLATVRHLRDRGASIVAIARSAPPDAVAADFGGGVEFVPGDVTREDDVAASIDRASALGPLRVVVGCAGTGNAIKTVGRDGPFPLQALADVIQMNLIAAFNVVRLGAARIAQADVVDGERGVIVNASSIAAFDGQIGQAAYAASKAGVVGMTLPIARDLAVLRIRVVTVAPGLFDTPLFAPLPMSAVEVLGRQIPHPARLGRPAEFAGLVAHVVENSMLNGETNRLDGALLMGPR